jgi:hypothetical protein
MSPVAADVASADRAPDEPPLLEAGVEVEELEAPPQPARTTSGTAISAERFVSMASGWDRCPDAFLTTRRQVPERAVHEFCGSAILCTCT